MVLQAAPDGLWIIDQVDLKIYKVDWETGDVLFEAQTDTGAFERDHNRWWDMCGSHPHLNYK